MSTFSRTTVICPCCRQSFTAAFVNSTNAFGHMDLDTRPPEMERSTLRVRVHTCPSCGFVSVEREEPEIDEQLKDYVAGEDYRTAEHHRNLPPHSAAYYKRGLILLQQKEVFAAMLAFLRAAWDADDEQREDAAKLCRERAISLFPQIGDEVGDRVVLKADILRRAGHFDEVVEKYAGVTLEADLLTALLIIEVELSKLRDGACYTTAVLKDPRWQAVLEAY